MQEVKVKRDELLEVIRKNRSAHRDLFKQAQDGFRERVIAELDRRLEDARQGRKIDIRIGLAEPMDQTKDYDRVIKMLEMSVDPEIELQADEFAQYVMDDWSWKAQVTATNAFYAVNR